MMETSYISVVEEDDEIINNTTTSSAAEPRPRRQRRRYGHIVSLMHMTKAHTASGQLLLGGRVVDARTLGINIATYLAWRDLQERRRDILPNLPELMGSFDCDDMSWSLELRDATHSRLALVETLLELIQRRPITSTSDGRQRTLQTTFRIIDDENEEEQEGEKITDDDDDDDDSQQQQQQLPFAIMGPVLPEMDKLVSELAGAGMGIVHMNGASTSLGLDGAPLTARTVAASPHVAQSAIQYLASLNVTRVANIFPLDNSLAVQLNTWMQQEASQHHNMELLRLGLEESSSGGGLGRLVMAYEKLMLQLLESQIKYVIVIVRQAELPILIKMALKHDVIGNPDYVWVWYEFRSVAQPDFEIDRQTQGDVAKAFHGSAIVYASIPPNPLYYMAYKQFTMSPQEQANFLSLMPPNEREPLQNHTFEFSARESYPLDMTTYDAMIALGLASCGTPGNFTGSQLHQTLLQQIEFQGVSGNISFDPLKYSRSTKSSIAVIENLLLSDSRSDNETLRFDTPQIATVIGGKVIPFPSEADPNNNQLFVYFDNTTIPPPSLPPVENFDYNLIPKGLQAFGLALAGIVMMVSILLSIWTVAYRKSFVISASQPIFLLQLCLGTFIMASAIIPLTFQGTTTPNPALDAACMSFLWLFCIGLVLSISAVLSKTWRLGQLMDGSQGMRRVKVEPKDVALPLVLLLIWNVTLLTACTIISPFQYQRTIVEHNVDMFGRPIESHGFCKRTNDWAVLFGCLIFAANVCAVIFAAVQCYKVRNMSTYFSETTSLLWSMASLVESSILFIPLLIALSTSPTGIYIGISCLITLICLSFLVPIFGKKIRHRNAQYKDAKEDEQQIKERNLMAIALTGSALDVDGDGCDACNESGSFMSGRMSIRRHSHRRGSSSTRNSWVIPPFTRSRAKSSGTDSSFHQQNRNSDAAAAMGRSGRPTSSAISSISFHD